MSTAIGRFTQALLAGSQENTFALAHVNFDFSLFKVDAPAEFQGLGSCLTEERRNLAENGAQHITARKLGALFRSKLPQVPNLITAYGKRASEISKVPIDPNILQDYGLFRSQAGIDATIIWAAATSGPGAIEVQLLACMLARFWTGPEAVSIWEEIIEARKKELGRISGEFDFPEMIAIQANLTEEQIADWDAGARAWLKTADAAKSKQQTQQRLILNNISVAVNEKPTTYGSIMEAWITAIETVDKLLAGIPQAVHDGAALLGLASWHLYPDMQIYEGQFKEVKLEDQLIPPSGLLTIGLQAGPDTEEGIRWSLPLAKLQYYGDPVLSTKRLDSRSSREPFNNIMLVALGCLSKVWPDEGEKYHAICSYYCHLWKACSQDNIEASSTWLSQIAETSRAFLSSTGEERRSFTKLLDYGRRRCGSFLSVSGKPIPLDAQLLGMKRRKTYIKHLRGLEERIKFLRQVAASAAGSDGNPEDWIIVCNNTEDRIFATALPSTGALSSQNSRTYHYRWRLDETRSQWDENRGPSEDSTSERDLKILKGWGCRYGIRFNTKNQKLENQPKNITDQGGVLYLFKKDADLNFDNQFEHCYLPSIDRHKARSANVTEIQFNFFCGDRDVAALYYRRSSPQTKNTYLPQHGISLEYIIESLKDGRLNLVTGAAQPYLDSKWYTPLQALGIASTIHQSLGTTSSMNVTASELNSSRWFAVSKHEIKKKALPWYALPEISMASAFGCIVFFDTGDVDLGSSALGGVMAVSVDDSIYVSATLTSDPYDTPKEYLIHRTLGNVGKPGVSLLIPPANPRMRKVKSDEWNLVNHEEYNFQPEDSFGETSLHLWLTEYRVPYATNHRGSRNLQAFFQEAVISVHDRSNWVGDLDIIKALHFSQKMVRRSSRICQGNGKFGGQRIATSIDNYYELFDQPESLAIVRARGNWLGRLATTVLSVQLGIPVVILPGEPRAQCSHKNFCILDDILDDDKLVIC